MRIKGLKGTEYTYNQNDIIGSGYYGCVYKAHHPSQNLDVAIKVINNIPIKNRRKGSINGSEKEVNILKSLDPTPYTLSLVDTAKDKKYVYIITEYCEGGTLRNILASSSNNYLDETTTIRYLYDIANGLNILHSHGIMHRDLNLDNIFLRKGCCVIGDFGSATTNPNSDTACVGAPEYRAPEVFLANSKRTYNKQADLWSLGIIFHEMLFGKKPYEGDSFQEIERKVLGEEEYTFLDQDRKISKEAKDLLKKLLIPNPFKRISLQQVFQHPIFLQNYKDTTAIQHKTIVPKKKNPPFVSKFHEIKLKSSETKQKVHSLLEPFIYTAKSTNLHNYKNKKTQFDKLVKQQETDFKPDQVVWAKVRGYSWWPAVINYAIVHEPESGTVKKDYMITFLGEHKAGQVRASNIVDFTERYEEHKGTTNKRLNEAIKMAIKLVNGQMTLSAIELADAKKANHSTVPKTSPGKDPTNNAKYNITKTVPVVHSLQNHSLSIDDVIRFNHNHLKMPEPVKKLKTEDVFVRKHDPTQKVYDFQEFEEDLEFQLILPPIIDDPALFEEEDSVGSLILSPPLAKLKNKLEVLINEFVYEPRPLRCFKVHFVFLERILEEMKEIQPDAASLIHSEILQKIVYIKKLLANFAQDQEIEKLGILDTISNFQSYYKEGIIKQAFDASRLEWKYDQIIKDFVAS